jgi:hypothetical protein
MLVLAVEVSPWRDAAVEARQIASDRSSAMGAVLT